MYEIAKITKIQTISENMIEYPNILEKIFDKIKANNARAIIVGGYIRDYLLKIDSGDIDIDIEVYNVESFEKLVNILKEFGSLNVVGKSFGVCKLTIEGYELDFTLPRIDSKIAPGHLGFDIKIDKDLKFSDAARRRDFSINAIGFDVHSKTLLDPYNGVEDLKDKTLKMVDAITFVDDPLRVLRAVSFCSRYSFTMHKDLFDLCFSMVEKDLLYELAKERIYKEIKKILLKSKKPSVGFNLLKSLGALKYFESLNLLNDDDWTFIMRALDRFISIKTTNTKTNEILMLAILCYKFDETTTKKFVMFLSNDKTLLKEVLVLSCNLLKYLELSSSSISDYDIYKLATFVNIKNLSLLANSLLFIEKSIDSRAKELGVLDKKLSMILRGKDLITQGLEPSTNFSKILNESYEAQMRGEFSNEYGALKWLKEYLTKYQ